MVVAEARGFGAIAEALSVLTHEDFEAIEKDFAAIQSDFEAM
jgi:hypothetical protein